MIQDEAILLQLIREVLEPMEERLSSQVFSLGRQCFFLDQKVSSLERGLRSVTQAMNGIEALPFPYSPPQSVGYATEFHSVSHPRLVSQGY